MSGQSLLRAFVPLPAGATAVYTSSGLDNYRHSDWLGSARLETTPSRTVYGDVAYAPYGETYAASGTTDFSWTGINADVEPANPETLYDFPAREYGIQGRWPSPDPAGIAAVDPSNPQSWNRYAYVGNNPLAVTDPTGMLGVGDDGNGGGGGGCYGWGCGYGWDWDWTWNFDWAGYFSYPSWPSSSSSSLPPPPGGYGAGIDPFGGSFLPGEISGIPVGLICWFQHCVPADTWYYHINTNPHWNPKPQKSFPKDTSQQACLNSFYNTDLGAATKFLSPLNALHAWAEWSLLPAGKYLALQGARQLSGDSMELLSLTNPAANVTIEGGTAAAVDGLETAAPVGLLGIPMATAMDAGVQNSCSMNPNMRFFAP